MRFLLVTICVLFISITFIDKINGEQEIPQNSSFTRFFNGWFKKPRPNPGDVADTLTKEDFDTQFPRENSDKIISDAISQRILEESSSNQVDSPFIIEDNLDSQASEVVLTNDRDGNGRSLANTPTDQIPIAEALRIVNTSNLSDCVARVICELSCNANAYGNHGRVVFRNLIKLQFDNNVRSDDAKFFRQAASKGRQIVQGKRNCVECFTIYSNCNSDSKDLIAVSSMFKL